MRVFEGDAFQSDVGTDEVFEFGGRDFPEALEPGDFRVFAEFGDGFFAFGVGVAVDGLLFVAYAEEGVWRM